MTRRRSYVPADIRHGRLPNLPRKVCPESAGERAMRMNDMLIGQVCVNMLEGRDTFFGVRQFIEENEEWGK